MGKLLKQELRKWRQRKRLVQKQAADILNINLRTYQNWEEGKGGNNPIIIEAILGRILQVESQIDGVHARKANRKAIADKFKDIPPYPKPQ